MAHQNARERLLKFLDERAFDPILKTSPDQYSSEADKRTLDDVKRRTESEKKRYHENYGSADEIRRRFLDDLHSSAAEKVNRELQAASTPALAGLEGRVPAALRGGRRGERRLMPFSWQVPCN
jgi:hypothetical protein